jgi:hypothetical protein
VSLKTSVLSTPVGLPFVWVADATLGTFADFTIMNLIPEAAWSVEWVYGFWLAGNVDSKPVGTMDVCLL